MMSAYRSIALSLSLTSLLLVSASGQTSNDPQQLAADGQQALAAGHYDDARANFEQLAKMEPSVAEVHATLAAICFKQRDYQQAVREIHAALKLKPGLPRLNSLLGLSLSEMGQFAQALPLLESGFKQTVDPVTRRMCGLQLLRAYSGLNRDADAVETSLALNSIYPDDPEVLYHTGRIYGNYAYVTMEKLHDKAAGSIWMLQAQGEANESQKDYDAAIIAFNHVLQMDPRRPGIHYRLGRIHLARFNQGQKPEERDAAQQEFEAELIVDPGNGNAGYEVANLQASRGNLDEAAKHFQQVLDRYPEFEEALVGLAGIDLDRNRAADAVALLKRATEVRPDDEVAWYRLSQASRATGDKQEQALAMEAFRKLHNSTPVTLRRPDAADEVTPQQLGADANPN